MNAIHRLLQNESLNFVLTNRIPRRWLTRVAGRISKCEHPWVAKSSMAIWRAFADVDMADADIHEFKSMHACFTRQLRSGARPINTSPHILTSPCDGIIGPCGRLERLNLLQAKGQSYTLTELLGSVALAQSFANGCYATLRLTSGMYHRFHAPFDGEVNRVTYFSGDTWNVNPPALTRIAKLFCENERAVLQMKLSPGQNSILLIPVAAILVASIRLHFLDVLLHMDYAGPHRIECHVKVSKGEELGWFEHGSTIVVLAPESFDLAHAVDTGMFIRMGQPLMMLPA